MAYPKQFRISDVSRTTWRDMRFVEPCHRPDDLAALVTSAANDTITLHGKRHSQGGHTLRQQATALDLEYLQDLQIDADARSVRIGCGALWDHLHRQLDAQQIRLVPRVHQSSPYFSIGGSLAVNCHGRDPGQPPVAGTVRSLRLLMADGQFVDTLPGDPLFHAVLGGHGACGILTEAVLDLKPDRQISYTRDIVDIETYCKRAEAAMTAGGPDLHYAYLSMDPASLLAEACLVEGHGHDLPAAPAKLLEETVLTDDALAIAYGVLRKTPATAASFWALLKSQEHPPERLLNAMRAHVRFTDFMGTVTTDVLQEYFLPLARLPGFLQFAAQALPQSGFRLLSSTLRLVQQDRGSMLSYSAEGPRVSVVLNLNVPMSSLQQSAPGPAQGAYADWTRTLIEAAIGTGEPASRGAFYLAYARCATVEQFRRAYPGWEAWRAVREQCDPQHRFSNDFLDCYLA